MNEDGTAEARPWAQAMPEPAAQEWPAAALPWHTAAPPWPASGVGPTWSPPPPATDPVRGHRLRVGVAVAAAVALMAATLGGLVIGSRMQSPAAPLAIPGGPTPAGGPTPTGDAATPGGRGRTAIPGTANANVPGHAVAIAARVTPGIVDINTRLGYQGAAAAGTGMILTSSGEVLTNNHVIDGATTITATAVATGRVYKATVVGTDPTEDIAVLRLQGASGLQSVKTATSSSVSVGDAVVAIGNAGGAGGDPSVVTGTVQAVGQTITASDPGGANAEQLSNLIETDAPIQPGDSGGPLVSGAAEVIGVNTAASSGNRLASTAADGFAITIGRALSIARQIDSGQASGTVHLGLPAFLGVEVLPTGAGTSGTGGSGRYRRPNTSTASGAVVAGVAGGGPAAAAGLAAGDTITAVGSQTVASSQDLTNLLRGHHPGDRVSVSWTDGTGASHSATVILSTGPAD